MKCSVLISYYNDADFLAKSIESVLNQTFEDFELILINHASLDRSRNIAHSYDDKRIKHIDRKYNIHGLGSEVFLDFLDVAQGEYIKFFCADDVMLPNCLETLISFLEKNQEYNIVGGLMQYIDAFGKTTKNNYKVKLGEYNFLRDIIIDGKTPFAYPTVLARRDIIKREFVDRVALQSFDVILWVSILLNNNKGFVLDEVVIKYRIHSAQLSGIVAVLNNPEILRREFFEFRYIFNVYIKYLNKNHFQNITENSIKDFEDDFMEFLFCNYCIKHTKVQAIKFSAIDHLYLIMQNDTLRDEIRNKYGFNVGDLRKLIAFQLPCTEYSRPSKVRRIFSLFKRVARKFYLCKLWNVLY